MQKDKLITKKVINTLSETGYYSIIDNVPKSKHSAVVNHIVNKMPRSQASDIKHIVNDTDDMICVIDVRVVHKDETIHYLDKWYAILQWNIKHKSFVNISPQTQKNTL